MEARNRMIDVLRGIAAVAVALFHFNEPYSPLPDLYHRALKWGWLGVSVFFVVSGFCIAAAREKCGLNLFWFRRLARIYPPYWASLILVLGIVLLRIATTGTNDVTVIPKSFGGISCTIAALTSPASSIPGINWVYWSLGYELAFYILMGFLAYRADGICLILFSVISFFVPCYPFDQWGLFGLGVAAYYFTKRNLKTAIAIGFICFLSIAIRVGQLQALIGLFALLLIVYPPDFIMGALFGPLRRVGFFSYSLYLVHVPIGCYLIPHYLPGFLDRQFWPSIVQDFMLLLICIASAYIFFLFIEKPSHEFSRQIGRRQTSVPNQGM